MNSNLDMTIILVNGPEPFEQTGPWTQTGSIWNMITIGPVSYSDKSNEIVNDFIFFLFFFFFYVLYMHVAPR